MRTDVLRKILLVGITLIITGLLLVFIGKSGYHDAGTVHYSEEAMVAQSQLQEATQPFGSMFVVVFNTAVLTAAFYAGMRLLEEAYRDAQP